jgi:putative FmdB family regulatory protein
MPIYAYKCESCGHAKDVLQKISDPLLTICPQCGADAFRKQLTAAGFQLKGSGWYVTDFKGGNTAKEGAKDDSKDDGKVAPTDGTKDTAKPDDGKAGVSPDTPKSGTSPAPIAAPAAPAATPVATKNIAG